MRGIPFTVFEREIVFLTLKNHPRIGEILSWQYNISSINKRVLSEHGFFTEFIVPVSAMRLNEKSELILNGPSIRINDIKHKARFTIRVHNGALYLLEGQIIYDNWPHVIEKYSI